MLDKEQDFIKFDDVIKITNECRDSVGFKEHSPDFREGIKQGITLLFQQINEKCPKYGGAWVNDTEYNIDMTTDELIEKFCNFLDK